MIKILSGIARDFRNPITLRIGITATIGYGTLYYTLAIFAPVISTEFDVGLDIFFGIFALGLFLGGLCAPWIGRQIDQSGARIVMTIGSAMAALALVLMSLAPNLWAFAGAIILMELAGIMVLYEAAFAGLTQIYRQDARRHITSVTLIAGFASTLFWPLTQLLVTELGWRNTCLVFAVLHVLICMPLHWGALSSAQYGHASNNSLRIEDTKENVMLGEERRRAVLIYGFAICISGIAFAAVPVHILLILQSEGLTTNTAALVAMIIGPSQVIARIVEMAAEGRYTALITGRICLTALPISLLVLIVPGGTIWSAAIFASIYGIAQGLTNIVRGNVPLQLFGSVGYGSLIGKITGIRFTLNAGAPFAFAYIVTSNGIQTALWLGFILAIIASAAFWKLRPPLEST